MTREEAIKVLEAEKKFLFHGSLSDKHYEPAFDMAIEALLAKDINVPSNGDVISRQDVLDLIENYNSDALGTVFIDWKHGKKFEDEIKSLPSAQKTGKWIYHPERKNIYGGMCIECSKCGETYMVMYIEDEKYCRNCGSYNGARMEGEEE